jgi:hypothetical protein
MLRGFLQAVALSVGVVFLAGCHTYTLVERAPVGTDVRVRLPVSSPLNRAPEFVSLEGRVLENGDTLSLATETRRQLGTFSELTQFDTLRLASTQISTIETKEFSTARSIVLGVAIAGGATVAALFGFWGPGGSDPPEGGGPPTQSTIISRSLVSSFLDLVFR